MNSTWDHLEQEANQLVERNKKETLFAEIVKLRKLKKKMIEDGKPTKQVGEQIQVLHEKRKK